MELLLSTAFLPPIDYILAIQQCSRICIEAQEHYQKQSYRNRCEIVTAQGTQQLILPIVHTHSGQPIPITNVRLEYTSPWQTKMIRAIRTAYASSPYFIHYFDELATLLLSRPTTLLEYNTALLRFLLHAFKIECEIAYTHTYTPPSYPTEDGDLRTKFHPKRPRLEQIRYYQVFADRLPFYPNVSAIDFLFNEGGYGLKRRIQVSNATVL